MARRLRSFYPGVSVHLTQRGNNKGKVFHSDVDRLRYLEFLADACDEHQSEVNCYALMGNHIHLLVTPCAEDALPRTMQSLNTRYVMYFNRVHERTGTLWDGRYKASTIDSQEYLKKCFQYIDLNPVKDGYCDTPADFRWSSHRHLALGAPDCIVTLHPAYLALGDTPAERQRRYRGWFGLSTGV